MIALVLGLAAARELVFVEEISRHGARAPAEREIFPWTRDPADNFQTGSQLTAMGMRQHYLIGRQIRAHYLEEMGLAPLDWNKDDFKFYSTDSHRTLESAQS